MLLKSVNFIQFSFVTDAVEMSVVSIDVIENQKAMMLCTGEQYNLLILFVPFEIV